jgi:hypothetical protein
MATANATEGLRGAGTIIKKASGWFVAMAAQRGTQHLAR